MIEHAEIYAARRERVLSLLQERGAALILPAAPELHVGADTEVRYHPDPDLYYLTGCTEPEAVLVLCPSADAPFTLFVRERDPERERWTGPRGGVEAATAQYGADAAHPIGALAGRLPPLVRGASMLFAPLFGTDPRFALLLRDVLEAGRRARPRTGTGVHTVSDPRVLLAPLRLVKDAHEIALMRQTAAISVAAFEAGAACTAGAEGEWQVEAALEAAFRSAGATGAAFPSIVAAGSNATVLHYVRNDAPLRSGDLLLIDAGARYRMYCADISRTYPVNGRFTAEQRVLYEVVLGAHGAAVGAVRAGADVTAVEDAAARALVDGMVGAGLLDGTVDGLLEEGAHKRYFPHRVSHWLGLDVHDVGDYAAADGSATRLVPGMVLTIEPGLYVPADDDAAPAAFRGIGIRLEDDVLVTGDGRDVLTGALAIRPADVEALRGGG